MQTEFQAQSSVRLARHGRRPSRYFQENKRHYSLVLGYFVKFFAFEKQQKEKMVNIRRELFLKKYALNSVFVFNF